MEEYFDSCSERVREVTGPRRDESARVRFRVVCCGNGHIRNGYPTEYHCSVWECYMELYGSVLCRADGAVSWI